MSPSFLKDNFSGYSIHGWQAFSHITLNMSMHGSQIVGGEGTDEAPVFLSPVMLTAPHHVGVLKGNFPPHHCPCQIFP